MTSTVVEWLPVFREHRCAWIVLDSLKYLVAEDSLKLHDYVVMEDHVHLIASSPDLPATMRRFLSFTARSIVKHLTAVRNERLLGKLRAACRPTHANHLHQVWWRGFHPKCVRSPSVMEQKVRYIRENPVRAGLVERPEDWPYSSIAYQRGDTRLPPIAMG